MTALTKPSLNTSLALTGEDREPCPACLEKASELMIRRIEVKNGRVEIDGAVATDILLSFIGSAIAILDGATSGVRAENYVEMQCGCKEFPGEVFTLTVQRPGGKTPHQARQEAEAEGAKLRAENARLRADRERLDWLDAQRQDITDTESVHDCGGDPEECNTRCPVPQQVLLGHGWSVQGQCESVRDALDAAKAPKTATSPPTPRANDDDDLPF